MSHHRIFPTTFFETFTHNPIITILLSFILTYCLNFINHNIVAIPNALKHFIRLNYSRLNGFTLDIPFNNIAQLKEIWLVGFWPFGYHSISCCATNKVTLKEHNELHDLIIYIVE